MTLADLLPLLPSAKKNGAGWKAKCPAHDDTMPSLFISQSADGKILLKCFAGCTTESICAALNIRMADLFPERRERPSRIIAAYDYHDATGKLLFQVCRFDPKDFRQRRPDATALDGWTWNTKGIEKVLFRLPEILRAIRRGLPICLCEGEKDVLAMVKRGFSATCNPGGAGKWQDSFSETLRGGDVVVIADRDQPGRDHAQLVASKVCGIAKSIRVIELPDVNGKPVKDAADYFGFGGDTGQLQDLIDRTPEWTPSPSVPPNSDEETLQRLALLSPLEYERVREAEAEKLNCRAAILDKLVSDRRPKTPDTTSQGRGVDLASVEPWAESVHGADVLSQVADTFGRYVALPQGAADALALWCAHAHGFTAFTCSPRLNISSPEKGCGKTTLRDVVSIFVPRPLLTENLSVAVLFRVIEAHKPTLLADECDTWLRDNDDLRGMLNAGHRRGGQALRCEGESNEVRAFNVFAPAVLCGIGALPGTIHDRSIVVQLERAKPNELHERFDSRRVDSEKELCRKLARFIADHTAQLETCDPKLPDNAFNRLADNWRPLFAIAETAGGDWPRRAATAFDSLSSRDEAQDISAMLLGDIRQIFSGYNSDRLFSKTLVERLCAMSDRPWPEGNRGRPISETWLARRLNAFHVASRTLRIGDDRAKGYELADFQEAFDRYLPQPGFSNRDTVTMPVNKGENSLFEA